MATAIKLIGIILHIAMKEYEAKMKKQTVKSILSGYEEANNLWNLRARAIRSNGSVVRMIDSSLTVMSDEEMEYQDSLGVVDLCLGSTVDGEFYPSACAVAEGIQF